MNLEFNNIEDTYKGNFENFEVNPHERIWKNISKSLDTDSGRGKITSAFKLSSRTTIAIISIVAVLSTAIILFTTNKSTQLQNTQTSEQQIPTPKQPEIKDNIVAVTKVESEKESKSSVNETSNKEINSTFITSTEANTEKTDPVLNSGIETKFNYDIQPNSKDINEETIEINVSENIVKPDELKTTLEAETTSIPITSGNKLNEVINTQNENKKNILKSDLQKFQSNYIHLIDIKSNTQAQIPLAEGELDMMDESIEELFKEWKKIQFNNNQYNWYIGADFMYKHFLGDALYNDDINYDYPIIDLNSKEQILSDYQLGIIAGRRFKNQAFLELGLVYNNISSKSDFDFTWANKDTIKTFDSIGYSINPITGQWETVYDTNETLILNDPRNHISKSENNYKIIEVPITVGYNFYKNYRSNFIVKGGFVPGFVVQSKTDIYTDDEEYLFLEFYPQAANFQLSITAGVEYDYGITERLYLHISPMFKYPILRNFYKDYPIRKGRYYIGLDFGIKYWF